MASPYVKTKHDIGVLRQDGTTKVGIMLTKGKQDVPMYSVFDDEYLAAQFFTGSPGYGSLPAEKELALRQDDWRSGFGLDVYDPGDTKRYLSSIGMDMRFRGMVIAGPIASAATLPTLPTITDADLENWTGNLLDDWDESQIGSVTLTDQTGTVHKSTHSASLNAATMTPGYISQLIAWDDVYKGSYFSFTCWVYTATASSTFYIAYHDGTGLAVTYATGTGDWEQITVSGYLAANATQLELRFGKSSAATGSATCYFDDWEVASPVRGVITCSADFNDEMYYAEGSMLNKMNASGTHTFVNNFIANITDIEPFTDDKLYIALGLSQAYYEMTTSDVFTINTLANNNMKFMKAVHTTAPTMYASDGENTLRSTVGPQDGGIAWSAQTTVGSSFHSITDLLTTSGALYIPKEDMIYYLDGSGNVQNDLAPELEFIQASTSGKNSVIWQNKIYYPAGTQALLEIDGTTLTWRNPSDYATSLSDFDGSIQAVTGDERYLFAIVDNSTKIEVLAGRLEFIDGSTVWVWHPINETTLAGCETAWVSSIFQKRLWIPSTDSTDSFYYIPLPTGYGDIVNDANRSFQTGSTFETPFLHGNFKDTDKAHIKLTLTMNHTYDADIYFTVKYKKLGDSSWTTIGNYTGSATTMVQSRFIPVDGSSNNPVSTMFKLQFTAVTDDTTKTPLLLSYHITAILYPDQREIIACRVRVADEVTLRDSTIDKASADTLVATLDEARTATWPVTFYDIEGDTQTVKFLPLPAGVPRWEVIKDEKGRRTQERMYNLLLQKVVLS